MIRTVETTRWIAVALIAGALGCASDGDKDPSPQTAATGGSTVLPTGGTGGQASVVPAGTAGMGATGSSGTDNTGGGVVAKLPCGVSKVLVNNCQTCHAATPIGGAPMPLVTFADLQQPAKSQPTQKVYEVVQKRIHDTTLPMPPTTQPALSSSDMATLDSWLQAGALQATGAEATTVCDTSSGKPTQEGSKDGSMGVLIPGPGETCYEFKVHQSTTSVDDQKYDVGDGEHYEQFYYKVPWPADQVATSYATQMDNAPVLHHWLLFATDEAEDEGFHKTAPLPTLIGTNPILLAGWAVGGPNLVAPEDVGFELPGPGKQINVQWHFYNSTGTPQSDASYVQICTVPKAMRKHIGSITWAGTEDLNGNVWAGGEGMPPGQQSSFTTTCVPGRAGLAADESIHIIGFEPHMHRIGKNMRTDVKHVDGTMETLFDKPFDFGYETHYYQDYELKPGEELVTTCSFDNDERLRRALR